MMPCRFLWVAGALAVVPAAWGKSVSPTADRRTRLSPPTAVTAVATSATSLRVAFTDRTLSEQGFVVELQRLGHNWEPARRMRGRAGIRRKIRTVLEHLRPDTTYQLRVRVFQAGRKDGLSMVKAVKTQASLPATVLSNATVWDQAAHNSGTDLVSHNGRMVLTFREGSDLLSYDGTLRIVSSPNGTNFTPLATISGATGEDLRLPHLSIRPDGSLLLNALVRTTDGVSDTVRSRVWTSATGEQWSAGTDVLEPNDGLYSITWRNGAAYGVSSSGDPENRFLRLYTSTDGLVWTQIAQPLSGATFGCPNEADLTFSEDGTATILVRRNTIDTGQPATAVVLTATAPYTAWFAHETDGRFATPKLLTLPDQRILAAGRTSGPENQVILAWLDNEVGTLTPTASLAEGADSGYPGMFLALDGSVWISYHVIEGGKAVIKLAHVRFAN